MNKYNWKRINYPLKKLIEKISRKGIQKLLLMCYVLMKRIYILHKFQNTN